MLPGIRNYRAVARVLHSEPTPRAVSLRALFTIRSLLASPESDAWYELLARAPFAEAAAVNPSLYRKIVRPYLTAHMADDEKLGILLSHCRLLSEMLAPPAITAAYSRDGVTLAPIRARCGSNAFELRLASDGKYRKEGEHSLMLLSTTTGMRLSTMTFVCDSPALIIGGAQGLPKGVPKSVISDATKELFGLRPKALLVFGLRELAAGWGLTQLRAVGNAIHVSRHHDYALNRTRRPRLAYDEFWLESGGALRDDGFIDLPFTSPPREDNDIASSKRSLYRKRYAMLDALASSMRQTLTGLRPL